MRTLNSLNSVPSIHQELAYSTAQKICDMMKEGKREIPVVSPRVQDPGVSASCYRTGQGKEERSLRNPPRRTTRQLWAGSALHREGECQQSLASCSKCGWKAEQVLEIETLKCPPKT